MSNIRFLAWWSWPCSSDSASDIESNLQYITLQNAKIELLYEHGDGWYVMIDDMYYCAINEYPDEYENIRDMAEAGEICIGVVRSFWVHFVNFNNYDYSVITIFSPKIHSLITIESYYEIRKNITTAKTVFLCIYFIPSTLFWFLYWYFLSDGKLINKWRKYRKKQKKLNYKKRHKKKQQKAKKT